MKLEGFETMASDDQIIGILEDAGFTKVEVKYLDDEHRIVYGVWNRDNQTGDMPSQIVYVEEAPL